MAMRCQRCQRCVTWKKTMSRSLKNNRDPNQIKSLELRLITLKKLLIYVHMKYFMIFDMSWVIWKCSIWTEAQAVPSPRPGARTLPRSGRTHGRKSLGANPTHPTWKVVDWTKLSFNVHKTHREWKDDPGWFSGGLVFMMDICLPDLARSRFSVRSFDFPFSCCWLSSVLKSVNVRHMSFCNEVPLITPFFGDSWQRCQRAPMLCGLLSTHRCQ
jgi:hypothetical protein